MYRARNHQLPGVDLDTATAVLQTAAGHYRPRKQFIDQTLADAKAMQQEAEQQRNLYENRQNLWEQDKQAAVNALHQQLDAERAAPLDDAQKRQLEQCLGGQIPAPATFQYHQDSALVAGLRLDIGAWVLNANLQHELAGFAELAYEPD